MPMDDQVRSIWVVMECKLALDFRTDVRPRESNHKEESRFAEAPPGAEAVSRKLLKNID